MADKLSRDTMQKIDRMVERLARKAGYTGREDITYQEYLQMQFEQQREKLERKMEKTGRKFSQRPSDHSIALEIRTYLQDRLIRLMQAGCGEEEVLKCTMEKFDEAEVNLSFEEMVVAFDGFGLAEYREYRKWRARAGHAVGLFYAGFAMLGIAAGGLLGFFLWHTWITALIGAGVGLFAGAGFGLIAHAVIVLKRR